MLSTLPKNSILRDWADRGAERGLLGIRVYCPFAEPRACVTHVQRKVVQRRELGGRTLAEAAKLIIQCKCGQRMKVPAEAVGKTTGCVKCAARLTIEGPSPGPTKAAPPPAPSKSKNGSAVSAGRANADRTVAMLKQHGLVTDHQIDEAVLVQRDMPTTLWEVLVDIGHVPSGELFGMMSKQEGVTPLELANYNVPGDVIQFVPEDVVKKHVLFPIDKLGKLLTLAMACPIDSEAVHVVEERTGLKVKRMACRLEDVRQVINTYYPDKKEHVAYDDAFSKELAKEFNDLLSKSAAARTIFERTDFAPLEATVKQAELARSSDSPLAGLIQIAGMDPMMTLNLLSLANSAAYFFAKRVDSLPLAAALLGQRGMLAAMTSDPGEAYSERENAFDYQALWQRARFCAQSAQGIAEACETPRRYTAYSAGLLCELGRLFMAEVMPHSYAKLTRHHHGVELLRLEERLYKINHAEATFMVTRRLNLPPGLTEPVRHYLHAEEAGRAKEITAIVALAFQMASGRYQGSHAGQEEARSIAQMLRIDSAKVAAVFQQTTTAAASFG